jgi:hypothetical protein
MSKVITIVFLASSCSEPEFSAPSEDSRVAGVMVLRAYGKRVDIVAHVGNADERYESAWLVEEDTLLAFDTSEPLDVGKAMARAVLFFESPEQLAFEVSREICHWSERVYGDLGPGCYSTCLLCKRSGKTEQLYPRGELSEPCDLVCDPCGDKYSELMAKVSS